MKDPATMTPGQINAELESLHKKNGKITDAFIEAGRGHETHSQIANQGDFLSVLHNALHERRDQLHREIHMRAGPGLSKMPAGRMFGPRVK